MGNSIRRKILLKGVTSTPDDYLCEDGELAGAMNVENVSGGLESSGNHGPEVMNGMRLDTLRVVFQHKVGNRTNMIGWDEQDKTIGMLIYRNGVLDFDDEKGFGIESVTLPVIEAVGNTIIIAGTDEEGEEFMTYVLWKYDAEQNEYWYKNLGPHIPEIDLQFGNRFTVQNRNFLVIDKLENFNLDNVGTDDDKLKITEFIRAEINRMHYDQMQAGRFVQPFLVRYALKMYDNTYTMASIPVFMPLSTIDDKGAFPYCSISDSEKSRVTVSFSIVAAQLYYKALSQAQINKLKYWDDIIKSVDVFVSAPIYTYTQNDMIKKTIHEPGFDKRYTIGQRWSFDSEPTLRDDAPFVLHSHSKYVENVSEYSDSFDIEYKKKDDYLEEVRNTSIFYKLASFDLNELKTDLTKIDVNEGYLNTLTTKPVLEDDLYSHDIIFSKYLRVYNTRLNIAGVKRMLYNMWRPEIMVPYMSLPWEDRTETEKYQIAVEINTEGQSSVVRSAASDLMPYNQCWSYLYYPNSSAVKIYISTVNTDVIKGKTFALAAHKGLNGSVFFDGRLYNPYTDFGRNVLPNSTNTKIQTDSKIYTSEAGNPWRFLPTNINTIGNGKVIGMAAVTTALSQGQHGSFPMYCFTTDGIFSLGVNSTGGWVTSQAVTRDVMLENTQLLQMDDAIVFVSKQGVMMLQGDKTELMSEDQKNKQTLTVSKLPGLKGLLTDVNKITDVGKLLNLEASDKEVDAMMTGTLMEYLGLDGRRADVEPRARIDLYYDYTNQRVFVAREDRKYCWVCTLDKNLWSMEPWQLLNAVRSYPDCYAMQKSKTGNYCLVKLNTIRDETDGSDETHELGLPEGMLALTRPIKAGEYADELKELENLTVEGRFKKSKIGLAVWGTRNYNDWHLIGSCTGGHLVRKHGSGWRAFVVAVMGKLDDREYLDSITMQINLRYGQKMHGMGY